MEYVYVLYSEKDGKKYTGVAENLQQRMQEHHQGQVKSAKGRRPLRLIYYEWSSDMRDAIRREQYLKTYYGKGYIKRRVKYGLSQLKSKMGLTLFFK